MVISCGRLWLSAGAEKAGMGGREAALGGAFSLSVVCDSWLEMAFGLGALASASEIVVVGSEGGCGNSLTIYMYVRCCRCNGYREERLTSSRRSRMCCKVAGHSSLHAPSVPTLYKLRAHSRVQ